MEIRMEGNSGRLSKCKGPTKVLPFHQVTTLRFPAEDHGCRSYHLYRTVQSLVRDADCTSTVRVHDLSISMHIIIVNFRPISRAVPVCRAAGLQRIFVACTMMLLIDKIWQPREQKIREKNGQRQMLSTMMVAFLARESLYASGKQIPSALYQAGCGTLEESEKRLTNTRHTGLRKIWGNVSHLPLEQGTATQAYAVVQHP